MSLRRFVWAIECRDAPEDEWEQYGGGRFWASEGGPNKSLHGLRRSHPKREFRVVQFELVPLDAAAPQAAPQQIADAIREGLTAIAEAVRKAKP